MRPTSKDIKETKALAKDLCPCNYSGKCVLFDECDCIIQSSPFSLAEGKIICLYFRDNVLPANPHLASLFGESAGRYIKCVSCGKSFIPSGNRQKYCPICKDRERRKQQATWRRQNYSK
jgi:hypothetical protein